MWRLQDGLLNVRYPHVPGVSAAAELQWNHPVVVVLDPRPSYANEAVRFLVLIQLRARTLVEPPVSTNISKKDNSSCSQSRPPPGASLRPRRDSEGGTETDLELELVM